MEADGAIAALLRLLYDQASMLRHILVMVFLLFPDLLCSADIPIQVRLQRIKTHSTFHGSGGLSVLKEAYDALRGSPHELVGLEDLWATALKEGRTLFRNPRLWRSTRPVQTGDMLGQTTIGPWQITVANARQYGARHGLAADATDSEVVVFLESQPRLQARMAADFIEASYKDHGRRAPLAIQRYFWLEAFLQKKIGQGPWQAGVLAKPSAKMAQTGFYAKQLLLGSRFNPEGLLYWLYRSGDEPAVRDTLRLWTVKGYPITLDDLSLCSCPHEFREWLAAMVEKQ